MAREEVLKEFGEFLVSLRTQKHRSLKEIEIYAQGRGVELPKSSLQFYEKGRVGAISRERLTAISIVYDRTYEEIVNRYVMARFGVDFLQTSAREELICSSKEHSALHKKLQIILKRGGDFWKHGVSAAIHAFYNSMTNEHTGPSFDQSFYP